MPNLRKTRLCSVGSNAGKATESLASAEIITSKSLEAHQQHGYRLAEAATQTEAARRRVHGSNVAQAQVYLDQQRLRLKAPQRRDQEALVKHQRAIFEIVRQTPDNAHT